MPARSLSSRLFLLTAGWSLIVLLAAGILLSSLYRQAVERAFDARLQVYLKTLVAAVAEHPHETDFSPGNFGEPRFGLPLSGWYWQIKPVGPRGGETVTSASLWDQTLPALSSGGEGAAKTSSEDYVTGPAGQYLRLVERRIDFGAGAVFVMSIAGDAGELKDEIGRFVRTLSMSLLILGLGVVALTVIQVRYGLRPLGRISTGVAAIRSGRSVSLEGEFPQEVQPLVAEINALLRANASIVERARTHVGNLAHALKTPLSVLTNEARSTDSPLARKVEEQAGLMRLQVQHHLERARAAARIAVTTEVTQVEPVVAALFRTMERVHRDRDLSLRKNIPPEMRFYGERQDLDELLGNLIDNACKWAARNIALEAVADRRDGRTMIRITVDDDGRGMTATQRETAMQRGQRLDETKPGSGLGLSIVADIAALYKGGLALGVSPQGGLRAELWLPGE